MTEVLPSELEYGFVADRVVRATPDGYEDEDRLPDGVPARGQVTFRPVIPLHHTVNEPATIIKEPTTVQLHGGDGEDTSTAGMLVDPTGNVGSVALVVGRYRATYELDQGSIPPFEFEVTAEHTEANPLWLSRVAPTPPSPAERWVVNQQVYTDTLAARDEVMDAIDNIEKPDPEVIETAVNDWLAENPPATTPTWAQVQDKPTTFPPATHNHDGQYAPLGHTHTGYAAANHNHDSQYAPLNHDHGSQYAAANHSHDGRYARYAGRVSTIWSGTQVQYDSLVNPSNNVLYMILESQPVNGVIIHSDSLGGPEGTYGGGKPLHGYLSDYLPGVETDSMGVPGCTGMQVAINSGGLDFRVTVQNDMIPASGTVPITAVSPSGGKWDAETSVPGTLAGVYGRITSSGSFQRLEVGPAQECPPNTRFLSESLALHDGWAGIIWGGTNDLAHGDLGNTVTWVAEAASRFGDRYVVVTPLIFTHVEPGSHNWNQVVAVEGQIVAAHGDRALNAREYLVNEALGVMNMAPTGADSAAIAEGRVPPSLVADTIHLNAAGREAIAIKVAEMLLANNSVGPHLGQPVDPGDPGDPDPGDPGDPDTQAPTVPQGIQFSQVTENSAVVSWQPSSDNVGVTGYQVELAGVESPWQSNTSRSLSGLTSDTQYAVRVRARDGADNRSGWSSSETFTTQEAQDPGEPGEPGDHTLPVSSGLVRHYAMAEAEVSGSSVTSVPSLSSKPEPLVRPAASTAALVTEGGRTYVAASVPAGNFACLEVENRTLENVDTLVWVGRLKGGQHFPGAVAMFDGNENAHGGKICRSNAGTTGDPYVVAWDPGANIFHNQGSQDWVVIIASFNRTNPSQSYISLNGSAVTTGNALTWNGGTGTPSRYLTVGRSYSDGTCAVDALEVATYDRFLTAAEGTTLANHLMSKHGIG